MIRQCISATSVLLLIIAIDTFGQRDSLLTEARFLRHLRQEKLFDERYFVLREINALRTPEFLAEIAWTLSAMDQPDSAISYYRKVPFDSLESLKFSNHYLSLLFSTYRLSAFDNTMKQVKRPDSTTLKLSFASQLWQGKIPASQPLPYEITKSYNAWQKMERKSAFVAGALSMVLPGTGKMYYGQRRQGRNFLFANAALGVQAYESYRKAGVRSARFITFGSLFSLFYIGNIYGTIKGLKKSRADHKRQLHYEISNYYFADPMPYPGRY